MSFHPRAILAAALLTASLLAGCATPTPRVDQALGAAVTAAIGRQTIDPQAGMQGAVPLDGSAAESAVKRYFQSFAAPPAATDTLAIGVSRGASGGHP